LFAALVLVLVVVLPSWVRGEFAIKDGDRVVFWGDSITDNAFYTRTIENYVRGRYPRMKVDFWNLGWGGDAASTKRIERDLPPLEPTLVLINLGMNDGAYSPFSEQVTAKYLAGIENLISVIRSKTKARIVLSTPITYEAGVRSDEPAKKLEGFYPDTLQKMSQRLVAFARRFVLIGCPQLSEEHG
jgi:lysophospholipase L1-like esterase